MHLEPPLRCGLVDFVGGFWKHQLEDFIDGFGGQSFAAAKRLPMFRRASAFSSSNTWPGLGSPRSISGYASVASRRRGRSSFEQCLV